MQDLELIQLAYQAREHAYAPYSNFAVGAALLAAKEEEKAFELASKAEQETASKEEVQAFRFAPKAEQVFLGCNIENASYTPTVCAERTAFFKAVSGGYRQFQKIAIVGGPMGESTSENGFCPPCGVCRQVMAEFCNPETFQILLGFRKKKAESKEYEYEYRSYLLRELLPLNFGPADLR